MSRRAPSILGQKFARLLVIEDNGARLANGVRSVTCQCDCGNIVTIRHYFVRSGHSRSCGCLWRDVVTSAITHGAARKGRHTPAYRIWRSMVGRCYSPSHTSFPRYGAKGIRVCDRWRKFEHFLADMGARPHGSSLDRIDGTKGYSPDNCRWATLREQSMNRRHIQRFRTLDGRLLCLSELARELAINGGTLNQLFHRAGIIQRKRAANREAVTS